MVDRNFHRINEKERYFCVDDISIAPTYRYKVQVRRDTTNPKTPAFRHLEAGNAMNPFSDDESLLYWLELNVYNRCTCLNTMRNPVSTQVYYNDLH